MLFYNSKKGGQLPLKVNGVLIGAPKWATICI
jgi:hypothetical protein